MHWMILPLKRYAEFSGRSRRMEYWMFQVFFFLALLALCIPLVLSIVLTEDLQKGSEAPGPLFWMSIALMVLFWLAMIIPGIAVTVRRLHDRDLSGWIYLGVIVCSFVPLVSFITGIAFLVLMFLPGTVGENSYGPDPKDPSRASVFE